MRVADFLLKRTVSRDFLLQIATGINDTGGKQWEQYQIADNLKWTWRKKIIHILILLPKEVKKKNENFLIEDFFHLPPVSTTPVVHLELWISPQNSNKFEMAITV